MLLAKVECKNTTVEKLAEYLTEVITEPGFRVWLYGKKVYAIFKVRSIDTLKKLIKNFRINDVKFKFFRVQEDQL